ncbi:MAG: hypothetical protein P8H35_07145 [Flavobacteriales bacterium]|nr:hypothetical protein [Flavobacteriales bacterium]
MKKRIYILSVSFILIPFLLGAQFYNRNTYRTQRNEITFGVGASACLTDVGGGKESEESFFGNSARGFLFDLNTDQTKFAANFSYIYYLKGNLTFRINLAYAKISGNDESTEDLSRKMRQLNFETDIFEGSGVFEWILVQEKSGNRYNLKNKFGKSIGASNPLGFGLYVFGGIGGFFYEPYGVDNFTGTKIKHKLRPLRTEGQGLLDPNDPFYVKYVNSKGKEIDYSKFALTDEYDKFAVCFPLGIGIKKSFHGTAGIKLEAGFRFTRTDYLDDVSTRYFNPEALLDWHNDLDGPNAVIMSGTNYMLNPEDGIFSVNVKYGNSPPTSADYTSLGIVDGSLSEISNQDFVNTYGEGWYSADFYKTAPGQIRGNPTNLDSYMFLTLSAYKKFKNTQKSFKIANSGLKRKIKASF